MLPFDGALDSGNQRHTAPVGIRLVGTDVQLPIVKGYRQCAVTELGSTVDQLIGIVRDVVGGIVGRV